MCTLDGSHLRANSRPLRFIYNASRLREPRIFIARWISPESDLRKWNEMTMRPKSD